MTLRSATPLEYLGDIAADFGFAAKPAIVLRSRQAQVAARRLHGESQVLQSITDIDLRIEKCGAIAAKPDAFGRGAFELEHTIFASCTAKPRIVVRFNFGNAERKPRRNPIGRRRGGDERYHSAGSHWKMGTARSPVARFVLCDLVPDGLMLGGFVPGGLVLRSLMADRMGLRFDRLGADAAVAATGVCWYCEAQTQYCASKNPCSQSNFHSHPFQNDRYSYDEFHQGRVRLHAIANLRVKMCGKASECVLNEGNLLHRNIDPVLWPSGHRGLGARAPKG